MFAQQSAGHANSFGRHITNLVIIEIQTYMDIIYNEGDKRMGFLEQVCGSKKKGSSCGERWIQYWVNI